MKHKTTDKHFKFFEQEVRRWTEFFGFGCWEIDVVHGGSGEDGGGAFLATHMTTCRGRASRITLPLQWSRPVTEKELSKSAFHEVLEVGMAQLVGLALATFSDSYVDEYVHEIVRQMENAVFEREWARDRKRLTTGVKKT